MKKHTTDDTMMDMKPTDYSRKDIIEYVTEMVWVSRVMETMR